MKALPLLLVSSALVSSLFAAPRLERQWETEASLKVPEGVLYDRARQVLYVSNIDGTEPWGADGAGSIARVALDGKIQEVEWVKGLNAPKGLALHDGRLYVADIQRVVVIDPDAGKILDTITVADAQRLNDASAAPDGTIYFTDSGSGRLYRLRDGKVDVASTAFKSPNGVLATADALYVLDQETLWQVDASGQATALVKGLAGHVDGVEAVSPEAFVVSCWNGIIYHARTDGTVSVLADTRDPQINAADIGYDPARRVVYVPTFWKNSVVAYALKD